MSPSFDALPPESKARLLLSFWAKLGHATWPETYHPVICHLIDVGQVARRLWERVLRGRVRGWVTAKLGLADEATARAWLAFWWQDSSLQQTILSGVARNFNRPTTQWME